MMLLFIYWRIKTAKVKKTAEAKKYAEAKKKKKKKKIAEAENFHFFGVKRF